MQTDEVKISDEKWAQIEEFMTVLRLALIRALFRNGSMTQKQLKDAINSTVTSLSNIIRRFDESGLELLVVQREGKYRRYSLSGLGLAYARRKWGDELMEDASVSEGDGLYKAAAQSLGEFKERVKRDSPDGEPGGWELKLDEAIFKRVCGELWLDGESEDLINIFLNSLENAVLTEDLEVHEQIMNLLGKSLLRSRIETFMGVFQPFVPLLRKIREGAEAFDVSCVMMAAITGQPDGEAEESRERIGLKREEYDSMEKTAIRLAGKIAGRGKRDIYRFFMGLLPEQKWLSSQIAQILYIK